MRFLVLALAWLWAAPAAATLITLKSQAGTGTVSTPVADTRLNSGSKNTNYGANTTFRVDATNAALVRFAIFANEGGPVPVGATINSATLKVYNTSGNTATIEARRLLKGWVEYEGTWNSASAGVAWTSEGAQGSGTDVASSPDGQGSVTPSAGWASIDVKASVLAFGSGSAPNYGWRLGYVSGDGASTKSFRSREGAAAEEPVLEIDYTSTATVLGVAPYAAGTDTRLNSASANTNYGTVTDLPVSGTSAVLIRFPIFVSEGGPVPNGSIINSATLSLYNSAGATATVSATRLLRSWTEAQATWNKASTTPTPGVSWTTAGALGSGTDIGASIEGQNAVGPYGWWSLDVRSGVALMSGGVANNGWRLAMVVPDAGGIDVSFKSGNTTTGNLPRLSIDYSPALTLAAAAAGANQANVTWSDVGSATGFRLERKAGANGVWSEIAAPVGHTLAYSDTGLSAWSTYYYRVKATTTWGETAYSNEAMVAPSMASTPSGTIEYTYDHFGNLKTTNAGGVITTLTYDPRGRKTQMADPDMGTWTYAYNALGELIRQTDAKSQVSTMAYDLLGRMVSRTEIGLTSTWTYDSCTKGVGKLCAVATDHGYSRTPGYDAFGRVSSLATTIGTSTYTVSYTYDAAGRLDVTTYPSDGVEGFAVKNLYTATGYLEKVQRTAHASATVFWQATSHNAAGQVTAETLGNTLTTTRTYDALFRLTAVQSAGGGGAVHNLSYVYDELGNVTQRTDHVQSVTENFTYDSANRLVSASGTAPGTNLITRAWEYNEIGNIIYKSDVGTYGYGPLDGPRPHAVANVGNAGAPNSITASYGYDANGSLVTATGTVYPGAGSLAFSRTIAYTSFNLPDTIAQTQGTSNYTYTYLYSAEHERVKLITQRPDAYNTSFYLHPGGKGALLYEKELRCPSAEECVEADAVKEHKYYVTGGSGLVGVYVITHSAATPPVVESGMRYYHTDHLGSIAVITNDAGAVLERLAYEAFGERRYPNGTPQDRAGPLIGVTTDRGFTAHEHLDELNLIHMNGRIYDPVVARFMTADPLLQSPQDLQSYNRYSYVNNNPLAYTDPSGYLKLGKIFKAAVIAVAAYYGVTELMSGFTAASGGTSIFGTSIVTSSNTLGFAASGLGSGIAGGFAAGMGMSGGNLEAGLKGAVSGALISFAAPYLPSGTLGDMVGSGINGYLQTGDSRGFVRGFAAGAIPNDLGFSSAYRNDPLANVGIGIARDGLRGGIVGGKDGILRGIAIGQGTNAIGHLVGFTLSGFEAPRFITGDGAFVYPRQFLDYEAITLGNVVSGSSKFLEDSIVGIPGATNLDHELAHVPQSRFLGGLYMPVHALMLSVSKVLTGDTHSRFNPLECSPSWISVPAGSGAPDSHCR